MRQLVLPLFTLHEGKVRLLGSATRIGDDLLLTCRHCLLDNEKRVRDSVFTENQVNLSVVETSEDHDLALLRTHAPLKPVPEEIVFSLAQIDLGSRVTVEGYPRASNGKVADIYSARVALFGSGMPGGSPKDIQLVGGVPEGLSGGPVFRDLNREQYCVGVARLGGDRSATSRVVTSEVIVDFLAQNNVIVQTAAHAPQTSEVTVAKIVVGENSGPLIRDIHDRDDLYPLDTQWLSLPLASEAEPFRLLNWRVRLTPVIGRDDNLTEILNWASSGESVRVRFLVGPGGSGKSRLASEAADVLRQQGWSAGQIFLDRSYAVPLFRRGAFLIVDYPETYRPELGKFLRELARLNDTPAPIRVLFLSRVTAKEWQTEIDSASAGAICDMHDLRVAPLSVDAATALFCDATASYAKHFTKPEPIIDRESLADWLLRNRDIHCLPLFTISAALQYVVDGTRSLNLSGAQIMEALVRRERQRLDNTGKRAGWGELAASRLVALATLTDNLRAPEIRKLASDIGLPAQRPVDAVRALGFWRRDHVRAPEPDILAAELLFEMLESCEDESPAWLWYCLKDNISQNLNRLGRLAHDIAVLRGPEAFNKFSVWLESVVSANPDRAEHWRSIIEESWLPLGLLRLAAAIGTQLLKTPMTPSQRAEGLTNLANRRRDIGDLDGATEASSEAVKILRKLSASEPERFEPSLARALQTYSLCLPYETQIKAATAAIQESIELLVKLATIDEGKYGSNLARSLQVAAVCWSKQNDTERSLNAINLAVRIWREKADQGESCQADLAQGLCTLSTILSQIEDHMNALCAVREAVTLWIGLAQANPARYEAALAQALNDLARALLAQENPDSVGSKQALKDAIQIYGRVAAAHPARFEPELAQSLENLSNLVIDSDPKGAINSRRQAIEIQKKLAATHPDRYAPGLARHLARLSNEMNDPMNAKAVFELLRTAEQTVTVLLVRGENLDGAKIYAYVAVRADRLELFMEAKKTGLFYPEDFGILLELGEGEPSPDVRNKMETEYGFNHAGMIDIPDSNHAHEIVLNLRPPDGT